MHLKFQVSQNVDAQIRNLPYPRKMREQLYMALGDHKFSCTTGWMGGWEAQSNGGFKIFHTSFLGGGGVGGRKNKFFGVCLLILTIPTIFLLEIVFAEQFHDVKNILIYKVNCILKLLQNCMKLKHVLFYLNVIEKGVSQPLFTFVLCTENSDIVY